MSERVIRLQGIEIFILVDNESESDELQTEWGLSVLVRAHYPEQDLDVLFDTSITGQKVLSNMKKMRLDLSKVHYIVLSHKHFDHTGGLVDILQAKDDWVTILHGENFFKPSIVAKPFVSHLTLMPFLKEKIIALKGMLTPIRTPLEFAPGMFVSGKIPFLTDFEVPNPPAYRLVPPDMIQDEIGEELTLIINLGKELVIVSGCSHRGIVNMIQNAVSVTGISTVRAIVGGLHLGGREQRISRTIEELDKLAVKEFYIGHCTGEKAIEQFKATFGDRVHRTQSGMLIEF